MTKSNRKNELGQEMPELTLRDILAPLFRHRRIVIASFCCVVRSHNTGRLDLGGTLLRVEHASRRRTGSV